MGKKKEKKIKVDIPTEEQVEKKKKEKKSVNYGLRFFSLVLASTVLIVLAILIFCLPDLATKITVISIGLLILGFGVIRSVPLLASKTLQKKSKIVYGIEICLDIAIGLTLFIMGLQLKENVEQAFIVKYFRFFVGCAFYFKGVFYFITTALFADKTTSVEFWTHIFIMTFGTLLFAFEFTASTLAIILASLLLIIALLMVFYAMDAYKKYRGNIDKGAKGEVKAEVEPVKVETEEVEIQEQI